MKLFGITYETIYNTTRVKFSTVIVPADNDKLQDFVSHLRGNPKVTNISVKTKTALDIYRELISERVL